MIKTPWAQVTLPDVYPFNTAQPKARSRLRQGLVLLVGCLAITVSHAGVPALESSTSHYSPVLPLETGAGEYSQERLWFEHAESALRQGHKAKYQALKTRLKGYPLYPYLELQELQTRLRVAEPQEVEALLRLHQDLPLASLVETRWQLELGRRQDWQALASTAPATTASAGLRCLWLRAQLQTGNLQAVMADMPAIWLTGASLPDNCDPVISAWRSAKGLTPDLAWQRTAMAIKANNPGLAKYLMQFLPEALQTAAEQLQQVHQTPQTLDDNQDFNAEHPRVTEIVTHGLVRYSQHDPEEAARLWSEYRHALPFTSSQTSLVNRRLGLMLAVRYLPESTALLAEARTADTDASLYEWQARVYLRLADWQAVADTVSSFPEELRESARWQYWLARAKETLDSRESAQPHYARAAAERDFYGFLAADRLGEPYRLNHQARRFSAEDLTEIRALPGVRRARELYRMDRLHEARHEWRNLLSRLSNSQVLVASHLAQSWGWHEQGVMGAIAAREWDDLQLRFPLAHQSLFTSHAALQKLDVNWVYALARQESAFMPDARSSAGALGLLQLMPGTARQTANQAGVPFIGNQQLLEPAPNIQLGTTHLADLLGRFDNNRILATAAYNAGAHRVTQWLEEGAEKLDADVWIETMPYYETRQYVQNVLAYTVIYGFRRGEPPAHLLTERETACLCVQTALVAESSTETEEQK